MKRYKSSYEFFVKGIEKIEGAPDKTYNGFFSDPVIIKDYDLAGAELKLQSMITNLYVLYRGL